MTRHLRNVTLAVVIGSSVTCRSANGQHANEVASRINAIKHTSPCVDTALIRLTVIGKTDRTVACWLVGLAFHEVAIGRGIPYHVPPEDSAGIHAVTITELRFPGIGGATDDWYWLVSWKPRSKEYGVEVVIKQLTSGVIVRRAEEITP